MNENYRMILVDDEDDVRGRILSKINPESGFTVVGKAGNGYDALELIEEQKPHVVLTDIKMPFINGIELAKIIRRDYPTTKVAFISGYDEFDYARKAIELNVVSYLMKPVTSEDISTFLEKLKLSLDQEFEFLSNNQLIHQKYNESIPMLINSYLSTYRYRSELQPDDIHHLEQYNVNLSEGKYLVGIIGFSNDIDTLQIEETKIFIGSLVDKVFNTFSYCHHFLVPEGVVFIVQDDKINSSRDIDLELYEIIKYAEEYRQTSLEIGVSKRIDEFTNYPTAYRESEQALRHSKYFNMGQIIYFNDIEEKERKHIVIEESDLSEFEYTLKYGQQKDIKRHISQLLHIATHDSERYIIDPELLIIKIANSLINYSTSINVHITDVIEGNLVNTLLSINEIDELEGYIYDIIIKLRERNVNKQVNKTERIIEQVYKYIEKNYNDPTISLETLTDELNISISYLSMLLKKMKHVTFNKELIKYRMEKAKELLTYSSEKIVNIAKSVGYNEVYYFSHSFKKYTGLSPKEFRKQHAS